MNYPTKNQGHWFDHNGKQYWSSDFPLNQCKATDEGLVGQPFYTDPKDPLKSGYHIYMCQKNTPRCNRKACESLTENNCCIFFRTILNEEIDAYGEFKVG